MSIIPKNNRDLNQGLLHLCSKFGASSLNERWVIVRTSPWLIHTHKDTRTHGHTYAGNDNIVKTIGHLFYATSSFVHHFVAIGGFTLELRSGNAGFPQVTSNYLFLTFSWQSPNFYWLFAAWKYDILTFTRIYTGHTDAKKKNYCSDHLAKK